MADDIELLRLRAMAKAKAAAARQAAQDRLSSGPLPAVVDNVLATAGQGLATVTEAGEKLIDRYVNPSINYQSGVPSYPLRRELARQDTRDEENLVLNRRVGQGNWYRDPEGAPVVRPEGLQVLGFDPAQFNNMPTAVDETGILPTSYDVEEFLAEAGSPIAGGIVGAAAGLPLGPFGSAAMAALGAMGGRGFQEAGESLAGENLQAPGQVGMDLGVEGLLGAIPGEIGRAGIGKIGGRLMSPYAAGMDPYAQMAIDQSLSQGFRPAVPLSTSGTVGENLDVLSRGQRLPAVPRLDFDTRMALNESLASGVRPSLGQVRRGEGLGSRLSGIASRVFGSSARLQENVRGISGMLNRMAEDLPLELTSEESGDFFRQALTQGRKEFQDYARTLYDPLRERLGGGDNPVVPTTRIRNQAQEILDRRPQTMVEGAPVPMRSALTSDERTLLGELTSLPDTMSLDQLQGLREVIRTRQKNPELYPSISGARMGSLMESTRDALGDIPDRGAARMAKATNNIYRKALKARKDALFDRAIRDPAQAGAIQPEDLVDRLIKPGSSSRITRFLNNVPAEYRPRVERAALTKVLKDAARGGEGVADLIAQGGNLMTTLRNYDADTLRALFGPERTSRLFELGRVMELNSRKVRDYGQLVAASIAARPIANLGRMAQLGSLNRIFESPTGIKWLTQGLDIKNRHLVRPGQSGRISTTAKNATKAAIDQIGETLTWLGAYGGLGDAGEGTEERLESE